MLVKVIRNVGNELLPDEIEVETDFAVGDRLHILYDQYDEIPVMSGIRKVRQKAEAFVKVEEIVCNMVCLPAQIWVFVSSTDPDWVKCCGAGSIGISEDCLKNRIICKEQI